MWLFDDTETKFANPSFCECLFACLLQLGQGHVPVLVHIELLCETVEFRLGQSHAMLHGNVGNVQALVGVAALTGDGRQATRRDRLAGTKSSQQAARKALARIPLGKMRKHCRKAE